MSGPETIEEELAIIAEALDAGIDPFLPKKEPNPWVKYAIGWFIVIMVVSWVSKFFSQAL
ncbi:MAG: hypothetical protein HN534_03910 [Euryarchaeota archaeon]|nr:hypothetical protein [Euryarchaeota archaeon]MBT3654058.1 hypothetical protein [Euryarchaeota archaeon]MBT3757916.1 hypothetical protein [Euryarchaeota archaeon]MBT4050486.1 hypothetical protein [Euryarchaeota archaeon]MBT4346533.1 hypothetical protein [Euryarchaeota archaeon]